MNTHGNDEPRPVSAAPAPMRDRELPECKLILGRVGAFIVESGLVAALVAAVALLVFVFVLGIFLPLSLLFAVGVYLGVSLILSPPKPDRLRVDILVAAETQRAIAESRAKIAHLEREVACVSASATREHVCVIARTANNIVADFDECPRHATGARFAFESLLDAAVTALNRVQKFSRLSGPAARRGREVLESRALPAIARGLQQLLEKLVQDDVRAINVDAVVLEQMLDLEGLTETEPHSEAAS